MPCSPPSPLLISLSLPPPALTLLEAVDAPPSFVPPSPTSSPTPSTFSEDPNRPNTPYRDYPDSPTSEVGFDLLSLRYGSSTTASSRYGRELDTRQDQGAVLIQLPNGLRTVFRPSASTAAKSTPIPRLDASTKSRITSGTTTRNPLPRKPLGELKLIDNSPSPVRPSFTALPKTRVPPSSSERRLALPAPVSPSPSPPSSTYSYSFSPSPADSQLLTPNLYSLNSPEHDFELDLPYLPPRLGLEFLRTFQSDRAIILDTPEEVSALFTYNPPRLPFPVVDFPAYSLKEKYKPIGEKGRTDRPDLDEDYRVGRPAKKVTPEKRKREDVEDQLDRVLVKWGAKSTPYAASRRERLESSAADSDFHESDLGESDWDSDSDSDCDTFREDLCQTEDLLHLDEAEALGPIYARDHDYPVSEEGLSEIDVTEDLLGLGMDYRTQNGRGGKVARERWDRFAQDAEGELVDGLTGLGIGDRWKAEEGPDVGVPVS